jgi:hypothetical protein
MGMENVYCIRLKGRLDPSWRNWFEGFSLTYDPAGHTTLSGPVVDQAMLHGLLARIRDLGLPIVSVTLLDSPSGSPDYSR